MGVDKNMGNDNNHSIIASQALRAWLADIFLRLKFSEEHAHLATDVLLMADLRGIDSHGVARLRCVNCKLGVGLILPASINRM